MDRALPSPGCAAVGFVLGVVLLCGSAAAGQLLGGGETRCRWQELRAAALEDSCLLSTDPFGTYGLLDRL